MKYSTHPATGRRLPVLSASSAQLYERCPRQWGHRYIDGLRPPDDGPRRRGTLAHAVLKERLLDRPDPPRPDDLAPKKWKAVLSLADRIGALVPGPRSGRILAVEDSIAVYSRLARWEGQVDLVFYEDLTPAQQDERARAGAPLTAFEAGLGRRVRFVVSDHKTTRERDLAKSESVLVSDAQAAVYSAWACERWGAAGVTLQWTYATTRGRRAAFPVRAELTAARAAAELERLDEDVARPVLDALSAGARATDLRQEWDACDDYGGCPHRPLCGERPLLLATTEITVHDQQGSGRAAPGANLSLFEALSGDVPAGPYAAVNRPPADGGLPERADLYAAAQAPGQQHPLVGAGADAGRSAVGDAPRPVGDVLADVFHPDPPPPRLAAALDDRDAPRPGSFAAAAARQQPQHQQPQHQQPQPQPQPQHQPQPQPQPQPQHQHQHQQHQHQQHQPQPQHQHQQHQPQQRADELEAAYAELRHTQAALAEVGRAVLSPRGFDEVVGATGDAREIAAAILRSLAAAGRPVEQAEPGRGYTLLVGCGFLGQNSGRVLLAERVIGEAERRVAAASGQPDYRLLDYAKGQGQLAYHVAGVLAEQRVGPGDLVVVAHPASSQWSHVGQVFLERAASVIRSGLA